MRTAHVIAFLAGATALGFAMTAGAEEPEPMDADDTIPKPDGDVDDVDEVDDASGICAGLSKRPRLECLLSRIPLTPTQHKYLVLTAYGESKFNRLVVRGDVEQAREALGIPGLHGNNDSGDVQATITAYNRIKKNYGFDPVASCGIDVRALTSGSLSWFQELPPNQAWHLRKVWPCFDPQKLVEAEFVIVSAIANAVALQAYPSFKKNPRVGTLRTGWWWPKMMANPPADRIAKYKKHSKAVGYGESFVDAVVEPFPKDYAKLYAQLGGAM